MKRLLLILVLLTGALSLVPTDAASQTVDLAVEKVVDNATPTTGQVITYTVTVTNNGPDTATNVVVNDDLPPGVTYISYNASVGAYSAANGGWTVGTLALGASETLGIAAIVDQAAVGHTVTNIASVLSVDQPDSDPSNDSDDADVDVALVDLSLAKTVDSVTPAEGDTIAFTLVLFNNGPDDATGVVVTDSLPPGLICLEGTASQGTFDCETGLWILGSIQSGTSATLTLVCQVDQGTAGTTITNTAWVTGVDQDLPTPTGGSVSIEVQPSGVAVERSTISRFKGKYRRE